MKNLQRCWMVKAVLASVPRGLAPGRDRRRRAAGRRAALAARLRGRGRRPLRRQRQRAARVLAASRRAYPDLRFIRDQFPPRTGLGGQFDCVYSISVLEHVPLEAIDGGDRRGRANGSASAAAARSTRSTTCSPAGAPTRTARASSGSSPPRARRRAARGARSSAMERDPETYLVSAEAHNQWRGAVPYDSYPMRRIGSVNLFARAGLRAAVPPPPRRVVVGRRRCDARGSPRGLGSIEHYRRYCGPRRMPRVVGVMPDLASGGRIARRIRDEVHTNVGLVRFTTADGRFRCSGTLISPTVVLTRGPLHRGPGDRRLRLLRHRLCSPTRLAPRDQPG